MCAAGDRQTSGATRNTIQRALVLEAVQSLRNHPTSADVYERVCIKYPNISRATVYRNLGMLAERGDVLRVEVPNGADRYDYFNVPHYHAKCRVCGCLVDVDMPYDDEMVERVRETQGFRVENYDIIFSGICSACQSEEGSDE